MMGYDSNTRVRGEAMSFIVRLWRDAAGRPTAQGEVEHIGTGERRLFLDHAGLIDLLENWQRDLETVH
ncbi:MAG TPA: hypothetical protein VFB58_10530 [Chloroflexota bacterium]|nr:hypothetical protein [Chloroflexota bacterium]